jgi:uncharacterized membrane protein YphA (DoxX/SURF4 family)
MFPTKTPGIALFVFRVLIAATLVVDVAFQGKQTASPCLLLGITFVSLFLCVGLFTPYAAVFCIALQSGFLIHLGGRDEFHLAVNIVNSLILAVLGPGAYSIDAVLFGRRRLVLPRR